MSYQDSIADTIQRKTNDIDQCFPICRSLNIPTPALIEGETLVQQQRRIMEKLRPFVSDELQKIKTDDAFKTAHEDNYRRFLESAAREAQHPSKVADGELKKVTRYDQAGRPYYEFYGKCSTWLSDFSRPKKFLVGIRTETSRGFTPGNVG